MEWNQRAVLLANVISDLAFERHRGATAISEHHCIVFGNDGYAQDERSRVAVDLLRQRLEDAGIVEVGFGVNDAIGDSPEAGYTWVMIVAMPPHEQNLAMLRQQVNANREVACG